MFHFFLTCQSFPWISYLKGRRRLSLSVPGTQEPRGVKVGDRRGSLAVSDLERRDVPEGGQVDVDGPKVAPVQDLRQEEYKDQRSLKWGMGRTGSTAPAVHTSPLKFRTWYGLEVLFLQLSYSKDLYWGPVLGARSSHIRGLVYWGLVVIWGTSPSLNYWSFQS